jgi:hypothetical protein
MTPKRDVSAELIREGLAGCSRQPLEYCSSPHTGKARRAILLFRYAGLLISLCCSCLGQVYEAIGDY